MKYALMLTGVIISLCLILVLLVLAEKKKKKKILDEIIILPNTKIVRKLNKVVNKWRANILRVELFKNINNKKIIEIIIGSSEEIVLKCERESKLIHSVIKELSNEEIFNEADFLVFRCYHGMKNEMGMIDETLKLGMIFTKDSIQKLILDDIDGEEIFTHGKRVFY